MNRQVRGCGKPIKSTFRKLKRLNGDLNATILMVTAECHLQARSYAKECVMKRW